MRSFASDNNSSVHPRIMEALMKAITDMHLAMEMMQSADR